MNTELIQQFAKYLSASASASSGSIVLLRIPEVIQWLCGDTSFLPAPAEKFKSKEKEREYYKKLEDVWGQTALKTRRPDLKLDGQWTNKFGEHIVEELYALQGETVTKPLKKVNYQPDSEISGAILEAKAQTFYTSGTAGEKILGTPFKYAEIPSLYKKRLIIVCMGGAEQLCREQYGNLVGVKCSPEKKIFIDFYKSQGIEYIGATDILRDIIAQGSQTAHAAAPAAAT